MDGLTWPVQYVPVRKRRQRSAAGVESSNGNILVLSWNINDSGNKMTDPYVVAFIHKHDIILFIETIQGKDFTLAIPGYKFHHVSRSIKMPLRAPGGIGILTSNQ